MTIDDFHLIQQYKLGEPATSEQEAAIARLYDDHWDSLVGCAESRLPSHRDKADGAAEQIVQDAIIAIIRKAHTLNATSPGKIVAWMRKVVRYQVYQHLRQLDKHANVYKDTGRTYNHELAVDMRLDAET